jgi:serine/threonine protein phosphatase 1
MTTNNIHHWQAVLRFERNQAGRDFVCGDIHGCFDDLEETLGKNNFDKSKDRLFCVGDLIDRGPRSEDALEYYRQTWLHSVLGNHEYLFYETYMEYRAGLSKLYYGKGCEWVNTQSLSRLNRFKMEIEKLPLIIKIDDILILHARLPDVACLEEIERNPETYKELILWDRKEPLSKIPIPGITKVYCGHNIVSEVEEVGGTRNIDTGCCLKYYGYGGNLTMEKLS